MEKNKETKPKYWKSMEELDPSHWSDPEVKKRHEQEFYHKPIETIAMLEKIDSRGMARRDFLTVMGAGIALSSMACYRRPVHKIIPYVNHPENITLGVADYYSSTSPSGAGILVKTREGRPIKMEGNPDHPINAGKLAARDQAQILDLYDPDRLKAPLLNGKKSTWKEVDRFVAKALQDSVRSRGRVRVLSNPVSGPAERALVEEFLKGFRGANMVEFAPNGHDEIYEAQKVTYGKRVRPRYRFDQAEVVVSFGADFLGTWLSPLEYARDWAKSRKLENQDYRKATVSRLYSFESHITITGSNADYRYSVRPGDEIKIALSLSHLIARRRGRRLTGNLAFLADYTPEAVAKEIGGKLSVADIKKVADDLWAAQGKSLVVAGGLSCKTEKAVELQIAVNYLNSELSNEGKTVDGVTLAQRIRTTIRDLFNLIRDMKNGKVDILILNQTNPAYYLPAAVGFKKALKKVKLVISFSSHNDETGKLANVVVPVNHNLEDWGDSNPRPGVYSLQQPTVHPLHDSRSFYGTLLTWAEVAGLPLPSRGKSWYDYIRSTWKSRFYPQFGRGKTFDEFWADTLEKGVLITRDQNRRSTARKFHNTVLGRLPKLGLSGDKPALRLALYEKVAMGDGTQSNNAWLQELPDPLSTVTWDNYVNISPTFAKRNGLKENDVVSVRSLVSGEYLDVDLPVHIQPGLHWGVVSIAVGYGREFDGKVGNAVGKNAYSFLQWKQNQLVYSGQKVSLDKTGRRYELARTQGHHSIHVGHVKRPIVNEITLTEYRDQPSTKSHANPHFTDETHERTLWPKFKYKGYRWGMSIDLNSCIGCNACMIACQAENNIPVVGRDRVRVSREMHWIRIDRYFSGDPEQPEVVFEPMLCQHCENAPCETVCPVLATVHSSEGLNEMTYNRCVGTRYCQNNCPYKVRRFNFFDHWKEYREPMQQSYNPEVTVRSRGIMEKCTFCTQRIQQAKGMLRLKGESRRLTDADLKTACQQTCPTDAIKFGDINNPASEVSRLQKDPRGFIVLEAVNTRPAITYLTKVTNREKDTGHEYHQ